MRLEIVFLPRHSYANFYLVIPDLSGLNDTIIIPTIKALLSIYYLVAFFLLATVLRFPLRVRELFLVRCPRVGKPLR